jgi:BirA family transcriptional regulator, biotin operon repressor / biotin---[acetyl-CoA-carboxylase] ligase
VTSPRTLDGIPAAALARRWGVPRCLLYSRVDSTLDAAHRAAAGGAPHGTVALALEQTAGRGRDGRTWHSPPGGVWLAVLLRPPLAAPGVVSIRAGLVVADVVDELLRAPATRLKWPNDILLRDRKLAGVLAESRWQGDTLQWLALGIGINVENEIPAAVRETAIALAEVAPERGPLDVLDRLVPPLGRVGVHGERLSEAECAAFAARDWLCDRALRYPIAGVARGVQADGALLVEDASGVTAVREGHVEPSAP